MIRFAKEFPGALRKILIIEREYGCGAGEIAQKRRSRLSLIGTTI